MADKRRGLVGQGNLGMASVLLTTAADRLYAEPVRLYWWPMKQQLEATDLMLTLQMHVESPL